MKFVKIIALVGLLAQAGCDTRFPVAYGGEHRIVVTVPDELWNEIGESVESALEPRIFTVRDERTFELTQASPTHHDWTTLRQFKQVLVIGQATDPWVAPVLGDRPVPDRLPALLEREGIWARGQMVTALVLPPGGGGEEILEVLPSLHQRLDQRYRAYVRDRMFVSGRDDELRERLRSEAGFSLLLPKVYRGVSEDSVYLFRNSQPDAARLSRAILVTWEDGIRPRSDTEILEWRDEAIARYYDWEQVTQRERIEGVDLEAFGEGSRQVQGIWASPPGAWPSAGPFITRTLACPDQDRTYFVDAWLYAPAMAKYEYMLQLETILDSFECGEA